MDGASRWRWVLAPALVAIVSLSVACGGDDQGFREADGGGGGQGEALRSGISDAEAGDLGFTAAPPDLPSVGPAIIKTAQVSLEVPDGDFHTSLQEITATADRFGGFVLSTTTAGEESLTGTIVLRVPSDDFEAALAAVEDQGKIQTEEVSGRDVTQEFVDLEARLRNLQAQESVLLRLMDRAKSISASIRVQKALTPVQLDIERIQGRLNFLEDRTAMSTISATLTEHGAPSARPGLMGKAWDNAVDVTEAIVYALVVSLGFIVPMGVLAGLVYLAVRLVLRTRPKLGAGGAE